LPHHLVESFKSTLDEVREADILMHVVDISHPNYEEQIGVVNKTLQDLNSFEKPIITIFNKMDLYVKDTFDEWLEESTKEEMINDLKARWNEETNGNAIFISALHKTNINDLRDTILQKVKELYKIRFPYKTEFFY
jgi:GTP-binding protein HflX